MHWICRSIESMVEMQSHGCSSCMTPVWMRIQGGSPGVHHQTPTIAMGANILTTITKGLIGKKSTEITGETGISSRIWQTFYSPTMRGTFLFQDSNSFLKLRRSWKHRALPQSTMLTGILALRTSSSVSRWEKPRKSMTFYTRGTCHTRKSSEHKHRRGVAQVSLSV